MSKDGVPEEDISRLAHTSATRDAGITAIQASHRDTRPDSETNDIGIGYDNSLIVKVHATDKKTFSPVQRVPVEILADIFVQCIPPMMTHEKHVLFPSSGYGKEVQQVRSTLGQVCPTWNIILNEEPRAWAMISLHDEFLPTPEIISSWIRKSKSHPLDVYISDGFQKAEGNDRELILNLLHKEMWRIRTLFSHRYSISEIDQWPIFPINVPTVAPMLQRLTLVHNSRDGLGRIHCPQLRVLRLWVSEESIKSLVVKPMVNVQRLVVFCPISPSTWHFKLLEALPNLTSLSWKLMDGTDGSEVSTAVAQQLKSLSLLSHHYHSAALFLRALNTPSLEHFDFGYFNTSDNEHLNEILDALCEKGNVRLRHLTLRNTTPIIDNVYPILNHLMDLEWFKLTSQDRLVDAILNALSPNDRDFSSACPKLKVVELSFVNVSMGILFKFVDRRVQSDLEEPAPGLVTCLKLSGISSIDGESFSRLVKTHGSSIHFEDRFFW